MSDRSFKDPFLQLRIKGSYFSEARNISYILILSHSDVNILHETL